jgi:hypothetical protein
VLCQRFAMLANQIFQPIYRFRFRNVEFQWCLANVKIHLARRAANVAEIGVGHFSGTVCDATHDRNLHAIEVRRCLAPVHHAWPAENAAIPGLPRSFPHYVLIKPSAGLRAYIRREGVTDEKRYNLKEVEDRKYT